MECLIKIANCRLRIAKCYLMMQEVLVSVPTLRKNQMLHPGCDREEESGWVVSKVK